MKQAGVLPDMVQVGNEVAGGMLWPDGNLTDGWSNFADLVKAGIRGVEAVAEGAHRPAIARQPSGFLTIAGNTGLNSMSLANPTIRGGNGACLICAKTWR